MSYAIQHRLTKPCHSAWERVSRRVLKQALMNDSRAKNMMVVYSSISLQTETVTMALSKRRERGFSMTNRTFTTPRISLVA